MNPVIMNLKMQLASEEKRFYELKIKAKRLFSEILDAANPYFSDEQIELIKSEEIKQAAIELCLTKTDLLNCRQNMLRLKEDIGDE